MILTYSQACIVHLHPSVNIFKPHLLQSHEATCYQISHIIASIGIEGEQKFLYPPICWRVYRFRVCPSFHLQQFGIRQSGDQILVTLTFFKVTGDITMLK